MPLVHLCRYSSVRYLCHSCSIFLPVCRHHRRYRYRYHRQGQIADVETLQVANHFFISIRFYSHRVCEQQNCDFMQLIFESRIKCVCVALT